MNLTQAFKMAFKSIYAKKTRSFLTMLGIIIGVASVVVMVSVVSGQNKRNLEYYEKMGDNKISVNANSYTGQDMDQILNDFVLGLGDLMEFAENMSPLGNASAEDCADYVLTLFSDLTRKVTMQNLYHDGGYSSMGMSMQAMHIYNEGLEYRDVKNDKSRRRNK